MKLNIMAFVMMIIAIAIGKMVGSLLVDMLGGTIGGTIIGTFIVGFICYLIYTLVTRSRIRVIEGIFFAVLVFFADFIAGYVGDYLALGGTDLMIYVITGCIMALLWSWVGGKSAARALGISRR
jgi:hypothetical protein